MIQSMTGYAAVQRVDEGVCFALEVRSLNHRYLKLSIKLPETLQYIEGDVDKMLRARLARGSVNFTLRIRTEGAAGLQPVNLEALRHYVEQLSKVPMPEGVGATVDLATVAMLPGVCGAPNLDDEQRSQRRELVATLTSKALDDLIAMRAKEGEGLTSELLGFCDQIRTHLSQVEERAPYVVDEYHERLRSRVDKLLQGNGIELEADGLMREVAIFAERCDINEELSRLRSHLDQFTELCERGDQVGRTLDFLNQELLREANTIASKSNDTHIARSVVEIKGLIDRLREQAQNVE